jgi:hypothetical protein
MAGTKTYNAQQVIVTFAGIPMSEYGEDEFVRIKRSAPAFELTMGVDGKGTRNQRTDDSATIEVVLMATSPVNAMLTAVHAADKASKNGAGVAPLSIRDANSAGGAELHFAAQAWISAEPEVTYKRGVAERVWTFMTDSLSSVHAGH